MLPSGLILGNKVNLRKRHARVPMPSGDNVGLQGKTQVLVSIVDVDQCPSGAIRVKFDDLAPGATNSTIVAAYVWPVQLLDFDRFVEAVQEAGLDRVSGGGVDLAKLRESWENHRSQIEYAVEQATRSLSADCAI